MVKKKSYSKESDKVQVEQELKETSPIVVRFHKQGCPACQMSQPAWDEFSRGMEPTMYRIVEIEENAIPPNILKSISAYPMYAKDDEKGPFHSVGAILDSDQISKKLRI